METPQVWLAPLPKLFWSEYSDGPFTRCVDCEQELDDCSFYIIQKTYVGTEPVFEVALCIACREQLSQQCSAATMQAMSNWYQEKMARHNIKVDEYAEAAEVLQRCLQACAVCEKPRSDCHRYSIAGLFRELDVVAQLTPLARSPIVICHDCEQSAAGLISQQTREAWDRFVQENLDGPPGIHLDSPDHCPMLL